jgi:isoaspartyl peptidase/L-asparaginase-like protein (Ntn-hydrolase superfamily)
MTNKCLTVALHGGAGAVPERNYDAEVAHMRGLIEAARDRLHDGATALDVAVETVVALEASGLYVAGRGASPNAAGRYELDASLMDGPSRRAGAVAALEGFRSPITAARLVMETTPHVMLAGEGAAAFARDAGLAEIGDPETWFTRAARTPGPAMAGLAHGTVGCVVCDGEGRLAAATSTGGVFNKRWGRVGDTPIPGAGTWADDLVAVSCTGVGEFFIRSVAAAQVAFRMRLAGQDLATACQAVLDDLKSMGGDGGLIAVTRDGQVAVPYNSKGMKRATLSADGAISADVFGG